MNKQPLITPYRESGELYRLEEDYQINLNPFGYPHNVKVKKGFIYDGASVPRWLWSLSGLGIDGLHRAAALVHDYLYENKGKMKNSDGEVFYFTRKQVDKIFRDMMKADNIADHRIWLAYTGVRLFGSKAWRN